jgi:hypothetical protein
MKTEGEWRYSTYRLQHNRILKSLCEERPLFLFTCLKNITVWQLIKIKTKAGCSMNWKLNYPNRLPSFGGEVKPSVPCRRFVACVKDPWKLHGSRVFRRNLSAISRPFPFLATGGLSCRLMWSASGVDGWN